jgi:hypothetical protein
MSPSEWTQQKYAEDIRDRGRGLMIWVIGEWK